MDGLNNIKKRITDDAAAEIEAIKKDSEEKIAALRLQYEADAKKAYDDIIAESEAIAASAEEHIKDAASVEVRKISLEAKQDMISACFDRVKSQLVAMNTEDSVDFLCGLLEKEPELRSGSLIFPAKDRELAEKFAQEANKRLGADFKVSDKKAHFEGGFILSQGDSEINFSYDALLGAVRPRIEKQLVKILFQEDE